MRRLTLWLFAVACIAVIGFLSTIDAHQANLRYILWKHHAWPFQSFMLPFLNVDGDFAMSLEGKTKTEIQRCFPVLIPPESATTDYQKSYSKDMIEHHRDYLWIGDSDFAVRFEDGKVAFVGPIKG